MKTLKIALLMSALLIPALATPVCAEPVTLNFWVAWDPAQADAIAAQKQIASFEQSHPNIKIVTQDIAFGALHDKLITSVAGGEAPDLSWGLIEWLGELNRMNALADLSADFAKLPDHDKIYPKAMDAVTIGGKISALPNYLGLRALLYHADMLKQAGVSAPPKTWSELIDDAVSIKQKTGKFGFGIAGTGVRSPQELIMYLAQNNVEIAKQMGDGKYKNNWASDPAAMKRAAEVFAFYKELADKGAMASQASGWGWEEEDTNFSLAQYAMVIDGSWMKNRTDQNPEQMKDVMVTAPPSQLTPATFFEVNPFYVFKSKHPQETWEFASFLVSHDFQSAVNHDRSPRSDVLGDQQWGTNFTSLTPSGIAFPPVALGSITRNMEESIGRVLLKGEEPAKVAAWLGESINKSLRQSGEISAQ